MAEPRRRRRRVVLVALAALATLQLGALALYRAVERGRGASSFAVDELDRPAPELTLIAADGRRTRVSDHQGQPLLVHFWATWCPPCLDELPGLLETARDLEVTVLAVSLDQDWEPVQRFFGGSIAPEVWRPAEPDGHRAYGVTSLPDTFWVDRGGRLRGRYGGARHWTGDAARAHLERAIRGAWPPREAGR